MPKVFRMIGHAEPYFPRIFVWAMLAGKRCRLNDTAEAEITFKLAARASVFVMFLEMHLLVPRACNLVVFIEQLELNDGGASPSRSDIAPQIGRNGDDMPAPVQIVTGLFGA